MAETLNNEQLRDMATQVEEEKIATGELPDDFYTRFGRGVGTRLNDIIALNWVESVFLEMAAINTDADLVAQRVSLARDRVKRYSRGSIYTLGLAQTRLNAYLIATGEYDDPWIITPSGRVVEFEIPGRPDRNWIGAGGAF